MNEAEWLACVDPQRMLAWVTCAGPSGRGAVDLERWERAPSQRKLCLFAATSFRYLLWRAEPGPTRSQLRGIETLERFADDGNEDGLFEAWQASGLPSTGIALATVAGTRMLAQLCCEYPLPDMRQYQCALLRELVGNWFRPVSVERSPGAWWVSTVKGTGDVTYWQRTHATVQAIAQQCYDKRDFAGLPVLADALEDVGCDSEPLLRHLRGQEPCWLCAATNATSEALCSVCGEGTQFGFGLGKPTGWAPLRGRHGRGCWALDLILRAE